MTKRSFTLVELMVTVAILSTGIVLVLRSFLSSATALGRSDNLIKSLSILEAKITGLEEKSLKDRGLSPGTQQQESFLVNQRSAVLSCEIVPLETEEGKDTTIEEARLSLSWKEARVDRSEVLGAYFPKKE